jgi:hypothetical protein
MDNNDCYSLDKTVKLQKEGKIEGENELTRCLNPRF